MPADPGMVRADNALVCRMNIFEAAIRAGYVRHTAHRHAFSQPSTSLTAFGERVICGDTRRGTMKKFCILKGRCEDDDDEVGSRLETKFFEAFVHSAAKLST